MAYVSLLRRVVWFCGPDVGLTMTTRTSTVIVTR
jgi:hypothetical protein